MSLGGRSGGPSVTNVEKGRESHSLHAPFRVTTHRGHAVGTFQSLESALEAAESLWSRSLRDRPAWHADLEPAKKIAA